MRDDKGTEYSPIAGVNVYFPEGKQPMPPQKAVMSKLICALSNGQNALLESPTGTGKTLALLCGSISWQRSDKGLVVGATGTDPAASTPSSSAEGRPHTNLHYEESQSPSKRQKPEEPARHAPRIYYCSRTHSQLDQVVDELKSCKPLFNSVMHTTHQSARFEMTRLGARENFCINSEVKAAARDNGANLTELCQDACKKNECLFRNKTVHTALPSVWDMEDIKSLGKRRGGCPYFSSRRKIDSAQVVFCPFNYIIDPHIRKATGIDLENCVVIFDEGHNIADVCRDAASIELTSKEMKKLQGNMVKAQRKLGLDNIPKVLTAIGDYLDMQKHKMGGYPKDRTEMFDAKDTQLQWTEMSLTYEMICEAAAEVGRLRELLDDPLDTMAANEQQPVLPRDLTIVGKLMDVAEFLLKPGNDVHFRSSVTWHFEEGEISFNIYCMTASLVFRDIAEACWSVVLTSGTLSPLETFAGELGAQFPVTAEGGKFLDDARLKTQCFASIVESYNHFALEGTSRYQGTPDYQYALGELLRNYAEIVRGGILVFLSSYSNSKAFQKSWRASGLLAYLEKQLGKKVLFEGRSDFNVLLKSHYVAVEQSRNPGPESGGSTGSILVAVCRGRVSEGMDFADDYARLTMVVGIPFPNLVAPEVVLKKKYQDTMHRRTCDGNTWYKEQAFRALNQAVGRGIRHQNDYCGLIFVDHRPGSIESNISSWIRNLLRRDLQMGEATFEPLRDFLLQAGRSFDGHRVLPCKSKPAGNIVPSPRNYHNSAPPLAAQISTSREGPGSNKGETSSKLTIAKPLEHSSRDIQKALRTPEEAPVPSTPEEVTICCAGCGLELAEVLLDDVISWPASESEGSASESQDSDPDLSKLLQVFMSEVDEREEEMVHRVFCCKLAKLYEKEMLKDEKIFHDGIIAWESFSCSSCFRTAYFSPLDDSLPAITIWSSASLGLV